MLIRIDRKKLDPDPMFGRVVAESQKLLCLHKEYDFAFDGYHVVRQKDITKRQAETPSLAYTEELMRKEGLWLEPDALATSLDLDTWDSVVTGLIGKAVMVENERKDDQVWVGIALGCDKACAVIHFFDVLGVFDDFLCRVPFRSITSISFGNRYLETHFKYLKDRPEIEE